MVKTLAKPELCLGINVAELETFCFAGGIACALTCRAPDKETDNEDALGLIPCGINTGVLVVADGLGGLPAGKQASSTAVRQISHTVVEKCGELPVFREAILDGIEQANQLVMENGVGSGTTVAAVEIKDRFVRPYHVGDSAILITGQRVKIKHQTISHSPVGYAVEAGVLRADDALHNDERHLVSNIIGIPEMRVEIGPRITLDPLDTLIVATDGLFDNLHIDEIKDIIRCGQLSSAAENLYQACRERMTQYSEVLPHKPDDLGFILFRPMQEIRYT